MLNKLLKTDPVITYNHMQEESTEQASNSSGKSGFRKNVMMKFIAEEIIIALLLALIFYMI